MRSWACYDRTCEACKDKVFMAGCPLQHSVSRVTLWHKKVMQAVDARASGAGGTVEGSDKLKCLLEVKYTGTVKEYMEEMQKEAARHGRHWRVYRVQQGAYHRMWEEETMVQGMLYSIMDFAMNYSHNHLTETQSESFAKNQTTLLPVVVWFLAPTGRDGKMEVQQHSRVYLSEDRRHSNNFVQKVLDDLLTHFKGVMEKAAAGVEECAMRRLSLWSDGCGGQFKNKWQMAKLVDLLGDTRFNLVGTEHHFFASCHGKGPCDGLGGWTKTYLRDEEMKKGNHMGTSQGVFDCLVNDKQYGNNDEWEAATGVQLKAKSRTFVFVDLVGVDRDVVKDMAGIKSNHCFVTAGGFIHMFPTSCTCPPCRGMEYEKCELVASGDRGKGKRMELKAFIPAIQEKRSNFSSTLERGRAVLAECRVGDWALMRAGEEQRQVYSDDKPKNWTCRGRFRLAQIAQLPKQPVEGARLSSRARGGEGKFLVFYAQEEVVEEEWLFRSALVCYREGGHVPKMWTECSESNDDPCYCKHADESGSVENVMMKIERRGPDDEGQEVCILTKEEKAALASFK